MKSIYIRLAGSWLRSMLTKEHQQRISGSNPFSFFTLRRPGPVFRTGSGKNKRSLTFEP